MFIGGLNWETTDQSLKDYFSQFGEVIECTVMRDGATGRSRGFGFLTFKDPKTVNTVMVKEHYLDGKIIDPKRAIPRDEQERTSKIFVGGVSQETTEQEFKRFFMQFGRVLDATLMMDKDTGRPRGFGFVTFDSEAAVDSTLAQPLEIHGKMIEVKKAQPRGNLQKEEEERKFGRQRGGGFQGNNQNNFNNEQSNQQGQGSNGNNNMSPAMMAQYWQRMQQYFQVMQQNMAAAMAQQQSGANMGAMGGMNQMNPQMMQQMMAMQQQAQNQQRGGTPNPQSPTGSQGGMGQMNPQMMNQMMQQGGMGGSFGSGGGGMVSPMNGGPSNRPGFTAQEQLAFEQQKYERQQQQQRMTQGGYGGGGSGAPTSWEGMYDDVPQPNFPNQGGRGNVSGGGGGYGARQNSPYQGGGGRGNRGQASNTPQPTAGNPSAPANAPTGPKNAGKPGANYRGGGMRGGHRGFHPYARGQ
ncbi:MAG: hypothetical protein Q9157_002202 [Trypethelium eluteriae]